MRVRLAGAALAVGSLVTASGYAVEAAGTSAEALGPGLVDVEVGIDASRFSVRTIRVHEGTLLRLHVRNGDPIAHELVVGDEAVHRAHAQGTERRHPPRPGELSLGPGRAGLTFMAFDEPGTYRFVCHLPGHEAYGMTGEIEVVPAD